MKRHSLRRGVLASALFLAFLASPLFALERRIRPSDTVETMGVSAYALTSTPESDVVQLVDDQGKNFAVVSTSLATNGSRMIHIDRDGSGEHLTLYWNGHDMQFETGDGNLRTIGINPENGELLGEAADIALLEKYKTSLKLAAAVSDDVLSRKPRLTVKPTMAMEPEYWNGPVDWTIDQFWMTWYYPWWNDSGSYRPKVVGCVGPDVRGNSYATMSRSAICAAARDDANTKCSNNLCLGCCQLGECDAYCILDDYVCVVAGVTGRSCGLY